MSKFDTSAIIQLIAAKAQRYQELAQSFAKSRFLLASVEYGQNDKEAEALQKIADGIHVTISPSETGVSLNIDFDDQDQGNYLEIIEHGMPAPYAGGDGGIVHNPDGTFEKSKVDPDLWGTRLDGLAKPGSDTLQEVETMLGELFTSEVQSIVQESQDDMVRVVKDYIVRELNDAQKRG